MIFCHYNVITSGTNEENVFDIPYNLAFFSQLWLYVICNNNCPFKSFNLMTFSSLMYLEKRSVNLVVCQSSISEGYHKSRQNLHISHKLASP